MKLSSLWRDHAVVQRDKQIVVWGSDAPPRTFIHATIGTSHAMGATSWDGRFELRLPALPVGGPYTLEVVCGDERCTCSDVLVGDVWLVSGQSNAEFPLMTFDPDDPLSQTQQYLDEGGTDPWIRCLTTENDFLDAHGLELAPGADWKLSDATTAPYFTAIGAWFALFIRKRFPEVPIGIIHSSRGGSPISTWLSRAALAETPEGRKLLEEDDAVCADELQWHQAQRVDMKLPVNFDWQDFETATERDRGNQGEGLGYAKPEFDDSSWREMKVPGSWMKQKIAGYGAIWVRRHVVLPESWAGQTLRLHLGGVDKHDMTYFNGTLVGATGKDFDTQYWDKPREYPIPGEVVKSGENLLAIRAFCFFFDGAFTGIPISYYLENIATGEKIYLSDGTLWKVLPEYEFVPNAVPYQSQLEPTVSPNSPHRLFDNKIVPLIPYGIRGVLWYQGENDADAVDTALLYKERMKALVFDWRRAWAQGDTFPFYFVQLANYDASEFCRQWLDVQDAQRRAYLETENTGLITATDLALFEPKDIHPHDKRSFGYRLALLALAGTYGDTSIIPQGPTLEYATPEGGSIRLHFRFAKGLAAKDGAPALKGFEVAGDDRVFHAAEATIDGEEVLLSSPEVAAPVVARYNAKVDLPEGNLVNGAGLPALTFIS